MPLNQTHSGLLLALSFLLQIVPGCALISPVKYSETSYDSTDGRQWHSAATYGHTADCGSFAERAAVGESGGSASPAQTGTASVFFPVTEISDEKVWPVSLLEVVRLALDNNEVIPVDVQFLSSNSPLLNTPQAVASVYDPVIQATGVAGSRGSLAATSDFIPQLSARATYGQDDVIQNNLMSAGLPAGSALESDTGNLQVSLQQRLLTGGNLELSKNFTFGENNVPTNLFPNVYQGQLAFELTQPLWGGAGDFFTSVAGPVDLVSSRAPSVDQGIVITRINEHLSHNDFQVALRQLIKDATDVYHDLHLVHRRYEIESKARNAAKTIWKRLQAKSIAGTGDGLAAEAQAEENYYAAEARVKDVSAEIRLTDNRLRRLIGHEPGHGLIIQPVELPTVEAITDDWQKSLQTAFSRRPELNKMILTIQSLEMQRSASVSLSKPRLDLVSNFHVNGFGDRPFNSSDRGNIRPASYYQNLLRGERTGWFAGVQFSVPLDRRLNRSLEHQLEYRLAKTRATLQAQKKEISHELWHAFQSAERWSKVLKENKRRVEAARRQVSALDAAFPTGRVSVDLLVRAHSTLAAAETEYARATTEYNKANAEILFRRGTLLEDLHISVLGGSFTANGEQYSPDPAMSNKTVTR